MFTPNKPTPIPTPRYFKPGPAHRLIISTRQLHFPLLLSPQSSPPPIGASRRNPAMQSPRSRVNSAIRRASGTFGTESHEERPPSPGGSSIKSNPSKRKRRISILRPDGKRPPGGPTSL